MKMSHCVRFPYCLKLLFCVFSFTFFSHLFACPSCARCALCAACGVVAVKMRYFKLAVDYLKRSLCSKRILVSVVFGVMHFRDSYLFKRASLCALVENVQIGVKRSLQIWQRNACYMEHI